MLLVCAVGVRQVVNRLISESYPELTEPSYASQPVDFGMYYGGKCMGSGHALLWCGQFKPGQRMDYCICLHCGDAR